MRIQRTGYWSDANVSCCDGLRPWLDWCCVLLAALMLFASIVASNGKKLSRSGHFNYLRRMVHCSRIEVQWHRQRPSSIQWCRSPSSFETILEKWFRPADKALREVQKRQRLEDIDHAELFDHRTSLAVAVGPTERCLTTTMTRMVPKVGRRPDRTNQTRSVVCTIILEPDWLGW
jgi:hypothetical protein